MPPSSDGPYTAAEAAKRLGTTVRALRVYERHGLVRPLRTAAGWRMYGQEQIAAFHQVIALKSLGLKLAQIAGLVRGETAPLAQLLALQEEELLTRQRQTERALTLVRKARKHAGSGKTLPLNDFIALIRETRMADFRPSPTFNALWAKHIPNDRLPPEHRARYTPQWLALIAEAEELKDSDPASPRALDLARRARAFVREFTGGDAKLAAALETMFEEGFSDTEMSGGMPYSKDVARFMNAAQERLRAAEA